MSSMGPSSIPGNTDQRPTYKVREKKHETFEYHENKREIGAIMEHING